MPKIKQQQGCLCGCHEPVFGQRRFRQGHDAKLKSHLLKKYRTGGERQRREALVEAGELGWARFMTDSTKPSSNGAKSSRIGSVEKIKVGRWVKEAVVIDVDDDGTTVYAYKDAKGATKRVVQSPS